MKTVGFIREHEAKILGDIIDYEDDQSVEIIMDEIQLSKIIEYLEGGTLVFAMTLALIDAEGKVIGGYEILTDGNWLWPKYYPYYLKRKKISTINQAFLDDMKSTSFSNPKVSLEKSKEAERYFFDLLVKSSNQGKEKK